MGAELTGGGLPDVVVHPPASWVQVCLDDADGAWARAAARRAWASSGRAFTTTDVELLTAEFGVLGGACSAVPSAGAYVLCPDPAQGPRLVLRLSELPGRADAGSLVEQLLLPAEQQLLPPQVEHASGSGAERIRVRQRTWSPRTGAVSDHIAYVFLCDQGAWILSTSIPDPWEAERRLPDLDELAAGVRMLPPA